MKYRKYWDYSQPNFYRFDEDSLFVAEAAKKILKNNMNVLDLFCGCGVIGLELWQINKTIKLSFVEKQSEFLEHIQLNIAHFESVQVENIIMDDFLTLKQETLFDLVVANPPYFSVGDSRLSPNKNKALCRHQIGFSILDIISFFNRSSKRDGYLIFTAREIPKIDGIEVLGTKGKTSLLQYRRLNID